MAMKRLLKIFGFVIAGILVIILVLFGFYYFSRTSAVRSARDKMGSPADTLLIDGMAFRDLNKNGMLDPYEDRRNPVAVRVEDLLAQMSVDEKAGLLFHTFVVPGKDGELAGSLAPPNLLPVEVALFQKQMSFFNVFGIGDDVTDAARWTNSVQRLAERTRLGIPVTFSTDPRHIVESRGMAAIIYTAGFSHWTDPIGLAAIGDTAFVRTFGRIAAQEYRAVGIHVGLHPMADLATEPRWARINGTFGEDAELAARLTAAYVRGFQGDSIGPASVATMTKHFAGGGPQEDGWDAHYRYGKNQVYPGHNFAYHLIPFRAAIAAGTAQIMPYYGVPVGLTSEDVGFGFNREMITGWLQDSLGFEGIVCTDWGLITQAKILGIPVERFLPVAGVKNYGVEDLTPPQRVRKALDASVDQFGGEARPEYVVRLVEEGAISESRLDRSVRKLLALKFKLGLFDDPYVDVERVAERVGTEEAMRLGFESQLRSQVLLTNKELKGKPVLPLATGTPIYVHGLDTVVAAEYGTVVARPEDAEIAILNLAPPFDPDWSGMFHQGRLYYTDDELAPVFAIARKLPTVITTYLERPAVIPELADSAMAILANFGASGRAIFDVLFGRFAPEGELPFEMPSSWEAVLSQEEDVPFDSEDPLFPFGYGLRYEKP
jgi:beta-glucosidase